MVLRKRPRKIEATTNVTSHKSNSMEKGNRAGEEQSRNWKDWLERHPLTILVAVVVATSSITYKVLSHFSEEQRKIDEKTHTGQLQEIKAGYNEKLKDLQLGLASIERHVGGDSSMDIRKLIVTPGQIPALGKEFSYFDDLGCYIRVPKGGDWSLTKTTELEVVRMIFGEKVIAELKDEGYAEAAKAAPIYLWKSTNIFKINARNGIELTLFPFVTIEAIENKKMFQAIAKKAGESENLSKNQDSLDVIHKDSTNKITHTSHAVIDTPTTNVQQTRLHSSDKPAVNPGTEFKAEDEFSRFFRSDMAGMVLLVQVFGGFQITSSIENCAFRIKNADKKGNVLYLHWQLVFDATEKRPKIYWDKEAICICNEESTFVVTTSAPSVDQRSNEGPWLKMWLDGLRIPFEH
jgi:hypothetical protein